MIFRNNIPSIKYLMYDLVEITNKMQPCIRIHHSTVQRGLNMFRAAYRSSSGAPTVLAASGPHSSHSDLTTAGHHMRMWTKGCKYSWSSWWWAVCPSKHVEPSTNGRMMNSNARLHLVGYFYWVILRCTDPWILNLSHVIGIILTVNSDYFPKQH